MFKKLLNSNTLILLPIVGTFLCGQAQGNQFMDLLKPGQKPGPPPPKGFPGSFNSSYPKPASPPPAPQPGASPPPPSSSPIPGSYELEKMEDLRTEQMTKLLRTMQINDSDIEKVRTAQKVSITVKEEGAGFYYSIKGLTGEKDIERSFESGKEFKENRFDGREYTEKITVIGRSGIREADFGEFRTHHVATFLPDGLDFLFTAEKGEEFAKANLHFKRV